MSIELLVSLASTVILALLVLRGIRATYKIHLIYAQDERHPKSSILATIRYGSLIKVLAALWFLIWAMVGIFLTPDNEVLLFARVGGVVWAAFVLDLPTRYLNMIHSIQDGATVPPGDTHD
ncbi:MAG TPA: hypothetical protein VFX15_02975 [Actinomycetes bacterium]|nr:hypothetical protein [Actinomycetes bacterium]